MVIDGAGWKGKEENTPHMHPNTLSSPAAETVRTDEISPE